LHLGQVAERAGRVGRHALTLPFGLLIDLAHAAETYTHSTGAKKAKPAA
jgi:hypothetical protein